MNLFKASLRNARWSLLLVSALSSAPAQLTENGRADFDACIKASHQTEAREHLATATRRPSTRPLARGSAERALPDRPGTDPANDPIEKAKIRRDGECKLNYDIWTEMHDKTIKAILAKQHETNMALYSQYSAQKSTVKPLGEKPDQNHIPIWSYLVYNNPGYGDPPVPHIGEEDTMIFSQVEDLTRLKAPPDRYDDIEQISRIGARQGLPVGESPSIDILVRTRSIRTSVEWFIARLATDLDIRPERTGGLFFWGLQNGEVNPILDDFRCKDREQCPFKSREDAEAVRQANMKIILSSHGTVSHIVELHER